MGIVTTKNMFEKSYKEGYAVGAFNVNNMEIIQGVVEGATELSSPIILQVSESALKYAKPNYLMNMIHAASEETNIPIAIHLDHGATFDICKECIDMGFTSVMIDGSKYDFEKNIELTREIVIYAHQKGVVVEAELGKLSGIEDDVNVNLEDSSYTNPEQALEFVQRTNCDSLAIAIGTSHGAYKFKGEAKLRFDILENIASKIPNIPLVLHGASSIIPELIEKCNKYGGDLENAQGIPEDMLRKTTTMGICKINIDSDIRLAMTATLREELSLDPKVIDPRKYLGAARLAIKNMVKNKIINVLGSENKA